MTNAEAVKDALAKLDEWQISRATGNLDLEQKKASSMLKAVRKALAATESAVESTDKIERYIILQSPDKDHVMRVFARPAWILGQVKAHEATGCYERVILTEETKL